MVRKKYKKNYEKFRNIVDLIALTIYNIEGEHANGT